MLRSLSLSSNLRVAALALTTLRLVSGCASSVCHRIQNGPDELVGRKFVSSALELESPVPRALQPSLLGGEYARLLVRHANEAFGELEVMPLIGDPESNFDADIVKNLVLGRAGRWLPLLSRAIGDDYRYVGCKTAMWQSLPTIQIEYDVREHWATVIISMRKELGGARV